MSAFHLFQMLLRKEIDIAIMDIREMPFKPQPKLELAAVPARANPFDVLISNGECILDDQPESANLAVVDIVSMGQLLYYRPDLVLATVDGEFEELYRLMKNGKIEGFVQAAADVEALGRQDTVAEVFTSSICTPVAGQGALGLIVRKYDRAVHAACRSVNDPASELEIEMERMFLREVAKDGRGPVGVLGSVNESGHRLEAVIVSPDGCEKFSGAMEGKVGGEEKTVKALAGEILSAGGEQIIETFKRSREVE